MCGLDHRPPELTPGSFYATLAPSKHSAGGQALNIYQVQLDGQAELYAAQNMPGAIAQAEQAYANELGKAYDDSEREYFRDQILQAVSLVGELASWPDGVSFDQLKIALRCLAECHTHEDRESGFTVEGGWVNGIAHRFSAAAYIDAWKTVRKFTNLPVDPEVRA
jgi:hypothetical protein